MKILITGGTGFIGKHLINRLSGLQHQLFIVDNLSASQKVSLPGNCRFFKADIANQQLSAVFKTVKPDIVYHLAADNRVTSPPSSTLKSNVIGTYNVLRLSDKAGIKQFIFTSSAAVYGESKKLPIKETHPKKPISAYGLSKLTGELYCQQFSSSFPATIFRFANVYGPGQNSSSEGGVVAIFIDRFLHCQKPIIFGNGQQTRDFVFVSDVVDALVLAIKYPQTATINIGSEQQISILQLLKTVAQLTHKPVQFISRPARPVEIDKSLFSAQKAKKLLHWQAKTELQTGLKQTIKYFQSL